MQRLDRLAAQSNFDRLLSEVLSNARPLPLRVRLRLEEPDSLPAVALGLALKRTVELTYRPGELSVDLAGRLLERQLPDGSFGSAPATAAALAGLMALADQFESLPIVRSGRGSPDPNLSRQLDGAIQSALHALFIFQQPSMSRRGGRGLIGDELDSAIVLWAIGLDDRLAAAINLGALIRAMEEGDACRNPHVAPLVAHLFEPSVRSAIQAA